MRKGISVLVVLGFVLAAPAEATFPGANGKITYQYWDGNVPRISTVNPDGTDDRQLAVGLQPAWSPDGSKLAFAGTGSDIYTINSDGTGQRRITLNGDDPAWSPDGSQIVFRSGSGLRVVNADGTGEHVLDSVCGGAYPDWGADGRIVFASSCLDPPGVWVVDADGSNPRRLANFMDRPSWSPGQVWVAATPRRWPYEAIDMFPVDPVGPPIQIGAGRATAWSPDGSQLAFTGATGQGVAIGDSAGNFIRQVSPHGGGDGIAWQPLPPAPPQPGYARPKGATPFRVALVPAYAACEAPDAEHGPPLAFPSCRSPRQSSATLTIGTPDANGFAARSVGHVQLSVVVPGDVHIDFRLTDVRCRFATAGCSGPLSDYTGSVDVTSHLSVTDRFNGGSGRDPATTQQVHELLLPSRLRSMCSSTADPGEGSTCAAATTLNAVAPGTVRAGKRTLWEFGPIRVYDSGPDGEPASDDNEVFATQGVFVP